MRILENLFGPDIDRYGAALNQASKRHSVLVENLANANVPGYKRKDTNLFLSEIQSGLAIRGRTSGSANFKNFATPEFGEHSENTPVDLEKEIVAITETQLHYSALSSATRRYFQELHDVIRGGK